MNTTAETLTNDWGTVIPFAGYSMDNAQVWEKYGSEWVEFPHATDDVYLTLKVFASHRANVPEELAPDAIALMTTGYAAPIDECVDEATGENTTPPSECESRRRVAIAVFVARDASRCTEMRFQDDEHGEGIRESRGSGMLSDAVDLVALSAWGAEYLARLTILAVDESNGLDNSERAEIRDRVSTLLNNAELVQGAPDLFP